MNIRDNEGRRTEPPTALYLVRIWKRRSRDGSLCLHGKLQHVVSGASCQFDGLSSLPEVLEQMMEQEAGSFASSGPDVLGSTGDGQEDKARMQSDG